MADHTFPINVALLRENQLPTADVATAAGPAHSPPLPPLPIAASAKAQNTPRSDVMPSFLQEPPRPQFDWRHLQPLCRNQKKPIPTSCRDDDAKRYVQATPVSNGEVTIYLPITLGPRLPSQESLAPAMTCAGPLPPITLAGQSFLTFVHPDDIWACKQPMCQGWPACFKCRPGPKQRSNTNRAPNDVNQLSDWYMEHVYEKRDGRKRAAEEALEDTWTYHGNDIDDDMNNNDGKSREKRLVHGRYSHVRSDRRFM